MICNYSTTNWTDFHFDALKEQGSIYQKKPTPPVHPPCKNTHTLSGWKSTPIPFSFLHKPKPILAENPMQVQAAYEIPKDAGQAEAMRTRPRIVMSPAISMDDIQDPRARAILCDDMYTSNMMRGAREAVSPYYSVRAPLPDLPSPVNPVKLRNVLPPVVCPEWRKESFEWDKNQLREFCDPNRNFWLNRELSRCVACEATATVAAHRKMKTHFVNRR